MPIPVYPVLYARDIFYYFRKNCNIDLTGEYYHNETLLLQRLTQRNPAAFQMLVETYFPVLCLYTEKIAADSSLAKDIVQDVFVHYWKQENLEFETLTALKSYLYTSARNGALNLLRGRERQHQRNLKAAQETEQVTGQVIDDIVRAEAIAQVYQVVAGMPENMKSVFYLSFEEGLSIQEIAAQLNIAPKTVSNNRYNAIQLLKEAFKNNKAGLVIIISLLPRQ